ncbi:hypothetical protein HYV50_01945 [Candidatus Pacearchaeota archaeon]|nr:hypothetical protein [Candidatus Pacearchaeota archaeon]
MKTKITKIRKKAQEEIVGFVLIMVLVAVIFLVFLTIAFRNNSEAEKTQSSEVSQFLDAIMEFTTSCSSDNYNFKQLEEIFNECKKGELCMPGKEACDYLNETLKVLIEESWKFSPNAPEKGYILGAISTESSRPLTFLTLKGGNCTSYARRGADKPLGGKITISLEICS